MLCLRTALSLSRIMDKTYSSPPTGGRRELQFWAHRECRILLGHFSIVLREKRAGQGCVCGFIYLEIFRSCLHLLAMKWYVNNLNHALPVNMKTQQRQQKRQKKPELEYLSIHLSKPQMGRKGSYRKCLALCLISPGLWKLSSDGRFLHVGLLYDWEGLWRVNEAE